MIWGVAHLAQGWEIMVIIQGCGELYMWVIVYASPLGMDHGVDRGPPHSPPFYSIYMHSLMCIHFGSSGVGVYK